MAPDIDERGLDLMSPIWHVLDLTPRGRGEWYTGLDYPAPTAGPVRSAGVAGR
jgi:predicted dithiol-disulfide oxidoreductase (DUF899 family)